MVKWVTGHHPANLKDYDLSVRSGSLVQGEQMKDSIPDHNLASFEKAQEEMVQVLRSGYADGHCPTIPQQGGVAKPKEVPSDLLGWDHSPTFFYKGSTIFTKERGLIGFLNTHPGARPASTIVPINKSPHRLFN
ncbi:hypothetical protein ACLOJK_009330 [Asimina triloba]